MGIDAESNIYLEDVKIGKPRKFVMICKGAHILSLIVYKRGSVSTFKKKAKKEAKGKFYHGVITGRGQKICFQLAKSDGYEKPPNKDLILKKFLNANTDLEFKPRYEIVEQLGIPVEEEDVEGGPEVDEGLPEVHDADDETASATVDSQETQDDLFTRRLKALGPKIKKALEPEPLATPLPPLQAKELQRLRKEMRDSASKNAFDNANGALDQIEQLLKKSASAKEMHARSRLSAIEPQYLDAIRGAATGQAGDMANQAKVLFTYASQQVDAGALDKAKKALDRLEPLLEKLVEAKAQGGTTDAQSDRTKAHLGYADTRFKQIMPSLKGGFASLRRAVSAYDKSPKELSDLLENRYQAFCRELHNQVCAAIKDRDQAGLKKLRDRVSKDPLVEHLAGNPFTQGEVFQKAIADALDDVQARLST